MSEFPKKHSIAVLFDIGEIVYLVTDSEQGRYTVMGYYITATNTAYDLYSYSGGQYVAWDFEISRTKDILV